MSQKSRIVKKIIIFYILFFFVCVCIRSGVCVCVCVLWDQLSIQCKPTTHGLSVILYIRAYIRNSRSFKIKVTMAQTTISNCKTKR